MSTDNKYLVLRGKNKDIYFFQKRVSKKIATIIGKDFIKKSLEKKKIIYSGSPDSMRDYIHVLDAARISVKAIEKAVNNDVATT